MAAKQKIAIPRRDQLLRHLAEWFGASGGVFVREAETETVASILPNLFGYHIVQLGTHVCERYIESTRISHTLVLSECAGESASTNVVAQCDALPVAANSVDVLVAPHVLEFANHPHAVLREAERVLIGEGYIVITGFNPWSLCGIWRLLAGWRGVPPWSGRFVSVVRIKDWLKLLGFEVEFVRKTSFRPPLAGAGINRRLRFMEQLGAVVLPIFGNVYVVVAKKHVATATPLRASWKTRRRMIAAGVAEPTTRLDGRAPNKRTGPR